MLTPKRNVKVWRNTGTVVVLEANAVRAVKGHFRYSGAAAGDLVRVGPGDDGMPLGSDGLFYLDGLTAGLHDATIETEGRTVRCAIEVPTMGEASVTNLGDVQCEETAQ